MHVIENHLQRVYWQNTPNYFSENKLVPILPCNDQLLPVRLLCLERRTDDLQDFNIYVLGYYFNLIIRYNVLVVDRSLWSARTRTPWPRPLWSARTRTPWPRPLWSRKTFSTLQTPRSRFFRSLLIVVERLGSLRRPHWNWSGSWRATVWPRTTPPHILLFVVIIIIVFICISESKGLSKSSFFGRISGVWIWLVPYPDPFFFLYNFWCSCSFIWMRIIGNFFNVRIFFVARKEF